MSRTQHEIRHGKMLASGDAELLWGWGTPAGRVRAARRARLIADAAGLAPGKRVLEVGCGNGMFTEMFSQSGAEIVAVDISPDLIVKARARGLPTDRVTFIEKRFEECQVEGPFDWLYPFVPRGLIGAVSAVGGCLEKIPCVSEFAGSLSIKAIRSLDTCET